MNIKEFLDLPEDVREHLFWLHNKQKRIRKERDDIALERKKLDIRSMNNQTECEHPYADKRYEAHENEFGNYTGGGEYRYSCDDCGKIWREKK